MSMLAVRASRLPLLPLCPASIVPPVVVIDTTGPEARLGTAVHECLALAVLGKTWNARDTAARQRVDVAEVEELVWSALHVWERILCLFPAPQTEVEYVLDNAARRVRLTGHVDLVSAPAERPSELCLLDWKTGRVDTDYAEQLRGYAYLALHHHPHVKTVRAIVVWIRLGSTDWHVWTWDELDKWWTGRLETLTTEREVYRPGVHCGQCPRGHECPARASLLRTALDLLTSLVSFGPDRGRACGMIHDRVKLLEEILEQTRQQIRAEVVAAGGVLPTGDDRELRLVQQERREIVPTLAWKILQEEGITEEHLLAECASLSKGAVERAVMARAPRGQKAGAVKNLLDRLDVAGALVSHVTARLEMHRIRDVESPQPALPNGE